MQSSPDEGASLPRAAVVVAVTALVLGAHMAAVVRSIDAGVLSRPSPTTWVAPHTVVAVVAAWLMTTVLACWIARLFGTRPDVPVALARSGHAMAVVAAGGLALVAVRAVGAPAAIGLAIFWGSVVLWLGMLVAAVRAGGHRAPGRRGTAAVLALIVGAAGLEGWAARADRWRRPDLVVQLGVAIERAPFTPIMLVLRNPSGEPVELSRYRVRWQGRDREHRPARLVPPGQHTSLDPEPLAPPRSLERARFVVDEIELLRDPGGRAETMRVPPLAGGVPVVSPDAAGSGIHSLVRAVASCPPVPDELLEEPDPERWSPERADAVESALGSAADCLDDFADAWNGGAAIPDLGTRALPVAWMRHAGREEWNELRYRLPLARGRAPDSALVALDVLTGALRLEGAAAPTQEAFLALLLMRTAHRSLDHLELVLDRHGAELEGCDALDGATRGARDVLASTLTGPELRDAVHERYDRLLEPLGYDLIGPLRVRWARRIAYPQLDGLAAKHETLRARAAGVLDRLDQRPR